MSREAGTKKGVKIREEMKGARYALGKRTSKNRYFGKRKDKHWHKNLSVSGINVGVARTVSL